MKNFFSNLFDSQNRITWRRLTMCGGLQFFSGYALIHGSLDANTWAWFAGGVAAMYVGGDTAEKVAALISAVKGSNPVSFPSSNTEIDDGN